MLVNRGGLNTDKKEENEAVKVKTYSQV